MSQVGIAKDLFGVTAGGTQVERYTLRNSHGLTLRVITYGATVTELDVPDRKGEFDDVVLGFDNLRQYERESPYFGCIVGRVAFRITEGRFELEGKAYQLTLNDGPHHVHGGTRGLSHVVWDAEPLHTSKNCPAVKFTYRSPDGDQGYPGNLDVTVVYALSDANRVEIDYRATSDQPTPVNLTHHGYFNLAGAASGDILGHELWLDAHHYSVTDEALIPTGELAPVKGTRFDFTKPRALGARLKKTGGQTTGYDLAYLLSSSAGSAQIARVATVYEPQTGRVMAIDTTAPAMVLYTGDYLDGTLPGKGGVVYGRHAGFCLEPGHLPDAVHHPHFPSVILCPGDLYHQLSLYQFSTK